LLFKETSSEGDLLFHGSSVNLDFDELSSLVSLDGLVGLSVSQNSEGSAELLDSVESSFGKLGVLSVLLGVGSEGLLLGRVPVLVKSSSDVIRKMVGPDSLELSVSSGRRSVSNNSNDNHGGSLDDCDHLNDFLLVNLGARFVDLSDNVSASGLEPNEGSQMRGLAGIILGEGSDSSSEGLCSLSREKSEGSVSWSSKLSGC